MKQRRVYTVPSTNPSTPTSESAPFAAPPSLGRPVAALRVVPLLADTGARVAVNWEHGTLRVCLGGNGVAPSADEQSAAGGPTLRGSDGLLWLFNRRVLDSQVREIRAQDGARSFLIEPRSGGRAGTGRSTDDGRLRGGDATAGMGSTNLEDPAASLALAGRLLSGWFGAATPTIARFGESGVEYSVFRAEGGVNAPVWIAPGPGVPAAQHEAVISRAAHNVQTWWSRMTGRTVALAAHGAAGNATRSATGGPEVVVGVGAYTVALRVNTVRLLAREGLARLAPAAAGGANGESLSAPHASPTPPALPALQLIGAVLAAETFGLVGLCALERFGAHQRQAAAALAAATALPHAAGSALTALADHAFSATEAVRGVAMLLRYGSPHVREGLRRALGARRAARRPAPTAPATRAQYGGSVPAAPPAPVAPLVDSGARRRRMRGRTMPAVLDEFVYRRYVVVQRDRSRTVYEKLVATDELAQRLEDTLLSALRRVLRGLPRSVLVDAAVGGPTAVVERIGTVWGRNGRRIFREDVDARAAQLRRGEHFDFTPFILARRTVLAALGTASQSTRRA